MLDASQFLIEAAHKKIAEAFSKEYSSISAYSQWTSKSWKLAERNHSNDWQRLGV